MAKRFKKRAPRLWGQKKFVLFSLPKKIRWQEIVETNYHLVIRAKNIMV